MTTRNLNNTNIIKIIEFTVLKYKTMRKMKFFAGLLLGFFFGISLILFATCSNNESSHETAAPDSIQRLKLKADSHSYYYKLTVDNTQYIIVENYVDGGVAIIKHK